MELEWDNEYGSGSSKIMKLTITYQPDGRYLIEVPNETNFSLFNYATNSPKTLTQDDIISFRQEKMDLLF